jgi:hypothetical protein
MHVFLVWVVILALGRVNVNIKIAVMVNLW